jgi:type VI secretion system secreted protein VgrG
MPIVELKFDCGEDSLVVGRFTVRESLSRPFEITVWATSPHNDVDLEALVGKPAGLAVNPDNVVSASFGGRAWSGVCSFAEAVRLDADGRATYLVRIVASVWLLDQRRNYRIYQHQTVPEIVGQILGEWGVQKELRLQAEYPKLEYRVQYGETDFDFVNRMLEEAGITYDFENLTGVMLLCDRPQGNDLRPGCPLPYLESTTGVPSEHVLGVRLSHEVRPGRFEIRDHDFRRQPAYPLFGDATPGPAPEDKLEQFVYLPGSFLTDGGKGGDTPVADDESIARHDEKEGKARADRSLEAHRASKRHVGFRTNCIDFAAGTIFTMVGHPRPELGPGARLLVTDFGIDAIVLGDWNLEGSAVFADQQYRPPIRTLKPHLFGVQSAIVVGPAGQEIYTDEFGRVRVQFHWDRYGKRDQKSSCWMRVSQGWAGTGFGIISIPRVGQEVLVGFIEGNPDQPIVVGRVFNATSPVPNKLPDHKTKTTVRSSSSPGGGGFNEMTFEDLKGQELIFVHGERDLEKIVNHDETELTGHDRRVTVGIDLTKLVGVNETETTGVNRTVTVGANHTISTGGSHTENVAQGMTLTVGAPPPPPEGGAPPPLPPAGVLRMEAKERLEIVVGAATLVIDKSGKVTLNGVEFDFTASGHVQINGALIDLN